MNNADLIAEMRSEADNVFSNLYRCKIVNDASDALEASDALDASYAELVAAVRSLLSCRLVGSQYSMEEFRTVAALLPPEPKPDAAMDLARVIDAAMDMHLNHDERQQLADILRGRIK